MPQKIASRKSKSVVVVYFGNEDLADLLSDVDYKAMQTRLDSIINPEDIKSLPSTIAGNKLVKLNTQTVVMVEGEKWSFVPTRSARARKDIENDPFVRRAITQLDLFLLNGKPRYVLVPWFAKLEKAA